MKLWKFFIVGVMVLAVSACSSSEEKDIAVSEDVQFQDHMPITEGPLHGDMFDTVQTQGAPAGTQQDLVVNVGDRVFFGYDRYDLAPEARMTLEQQANWLKRYPHVTVTIEGHADERGTREYNLALGDRRATSVRNYLIALGVAPSRISTISYGKERPAVMGSNAESWALNRRGVTVVD